MNISKTTANRIRRCNMSEIAEAMGIKRQAVFEWVKYQRVPNKRIDRLEKITGLKLR